MSIDPRALEFADLWLRTSGWSSNIDVHRLAELIDDLCHDFVAELNEELDDVDDQTK